MPPKKIIQGKKRGKGHKLSVGKFISIGGLQNVLKQLSSTEKVLEILRRNIPTS